MNFYGSPRLKDDPILRDSSVRPNTRVIDDMNCALVAGSAYRGRLLLTATLDGPKGSSGNEEEGAGRSRRSDVGTPLEQEMQRISRCVYR